MRMRQAFGTRVASKHQWATSLTSTGSRVKEDQLGSCEVGPMGIKEAFQGGRRRPGDTSAGHHCPSPPHPSVSTMSHYEAPRGALIDWRGDQRGGRCQSARVRNDCGKSPGTSALTPSRSFPPQLDVVHHRTSSADGLGDDEVRKCQRSTTGGREEREEEHSGRFSFRSLEAKC